jgi:pimeloyl-ACP methyl ester carboxylesterase
MATESHHPFRSAAAQAAYLARYDRLARNWPVANETRSVDTTWGPTHVRLSGPSDGPPLVLVPGGAISSLMWRPNVAGLAAHYRTYAVDHIYDSGRSVFTRRPKTPADLTGWLDETLTGLGLGDGINLMGLSFGGWLCAQYALAYPRRVRRVVLVAPPGITPFGTEFVRRFLWVFVQPKTFPGIVDWVFNDLARMGEAGRKMADELGEEIQLSARAFKPRAMVLPKVLKDEELRAIQAPTLYLVGENDKTCYPAKAVARLKAVAPQMQAELWAGAGHDITWVKAEAVGVRVMEFLGER